MDEVSYERPDWDTYFLGIANAVSQRADCRRRKVGAVITQRNRIVATGYNGTDAGKPGCLAGACPRGLLSYEQQPAFGDYSNCISRHAEHNALLELPWRVEGDLTMYINQEPCDNCITLMGHYGIDRWVSPHSESTKRLQDPRLHQQNAVPNTSPGVGIEGQGSVW